MSVSVLLCIWTSVECWSYHYSNTTMDWQTARNWCKKNNYTDMVAIQNQEEINHLNNWLPKKDKYYWIGIRKLNNVWTWVGTNKPLTPEATNWAKNEPNNAKKGRGRKSEDCVEMYVKRREQSGKWNDESCMNKKTALCYTAACKNDSCYHGECVETIDSQVCECSEGFYGEKCEHVVHCEKDEVTLPKKASVNCSHNYGEYSYDSLCQYSCEEGYQLSTPGPMRCNASGKWSEQPPTCELVQCKELSRPARGFMECSNPLGSSSYQSNCVFSCEEGYVLVGSQSNSLQCEASGLWNESQPFCVVVHCPVLQQLENGVFSCGEDDDMRFSYRNTCSFSCAPGYQMVGSSTVTCTSTAEWSEKIPRCEAITCQKPEGDVHLLTKCSHHFDELRPDSTCSFRCDTGFELQGAPSIQCSEHGAWTSDIPTCKALQCPPAAAPVGGQVRCVARSLSSSVSAEAPHPQGTVCTYSCDDGHELQVVHCPVLQQLENGVVSCGEDDDMRFSYGNTCSFSCAPGYQLVGSSTVTCMSTAEWSEKIPRCEAITCQKPEGDAHLLTQCSHHLDELRPDSTCSFRCDTGFELQGAPTLQCPPAVAPVGGQVRCVAHSLSSSVSAGTPHPQGTVCTFSCDDGHELQVVHCPVLQQLENGVVSCGEDDDMRFSYGNTCSFSCALGYQLVGSSTVTCTSTAEWSEKIPRCEAITCQKPEGDAHLLTQCSHHFDELRPDSTCSFRCDTGFELQGVPSIQCSEHGAWTSDIPTCKALQCPPAVAPVGGQVRCVARSLSSSVSAGAPHPQGTVCTFSCDDGHELQDWSSGGVQAWMYNYSTSPSRNWKSAREWCQQHFTDMVAIQNKGEIAFLNQMLPFNPGYYWIGIRKVADVWTWVGTNKTLTDEAENWATGEPNNAYEDCVEIYIKREKDTAKWNDERCRKKKGTVCYTASCSQDSCSVHADCVETIGNYTCQCHPGFQGPRCEEAIACSTMLVPEQGSFSCFNFYGPNRFNSSCQFRCDLGFQLVGARSLLCQANGHWDQPAPQCQVEQCPALKYTPSASSMNCSDPIAPHSYNSTCEVQCDEGYELNGQNWIRCDHAGQWTASVPACTVIRCSPISFPAMGNMTCVDTIKPFSFGSWCNFTCWEGFYLTGHNTLTCLTSGQWSNPTPTCTVVQCNSLKAPPLASMQCQDPLGDHSYRSICTVQCEEGFDLIGSNFTTCSSNGNWSHALPVCQGMNM
ncbi:P-selectin-like [Diretmus argenteus]